MIQENKNIISRRQTFISLLILSVLMVIGIGVLITQSHYNPAVLQKDALLPDPAKKSSFGRSFNKLFVPLPQGILPLTETETFDAGNLSDKIDGKAELYLSAGFVRLISQRFRDEHAVDLWMEVFVYDMDNSQNAFSVFSAQRREDAEPLDFVKHAYRTPNALFMTHGRYYVEIIASKAADQVQHRARMLAETFIRNTPAKTAAVKETALFPKKELVKNSMTLIASDAFGYDGFDKIYTAEYELDAQRLTAYLSHRKTPVKAKELASAYTAFLLAYGGQNIEGQMPIKGARLIYILDTYEIVFSHGSYLAGIREAATIHQAKTLALRLYHRIKEENNESRSEP